MTDDPLERTVPPTLQAWSAKVQKRFPRPITTNVVEAALRVWQRYESVTPRTVTAEIRHLGAVLVALWPAGEDAEGLDRARRMSGTTEPIVAQWLTKLERAGLGWVDVPPTPAQAKALAAARGLPVQDNHSKA